ncbi:hypothetical protein FB107DRAFT_280294 [Schizophyllum commune]
MNSFVEALSPVRFVWACAFGIATAHPTTFLTKGLVGLLSISTVSASALLTPHITQRARRWVFGRLQRSSLHLRLCTSDFSTGDKPLWPCFPP